MKDGYDPEILGVRHEPRLVPESVKTVKLSFIGNGGSQNAFLNREQDK